MTEKWVMIVELIKKREVKGDGVDSGEV